MKKKELDKNYQKRRNGVRFQWSIEFNPWRDFVDLVEEYDMRLFKHATKKLLTQVSNLMERYLPCRAQ